MPGAAIYPVMTFVHSDRKIPNKLVLILGLENGGPYARQYNTPGGAYDEKKDGYFNGRADLFKTARRETIEEIGIPRLVNSIGKSRPPSCRIPFTRRNGSIEMTPVWCIHVPSGIRRNAGNSNTFAANNRDTAFVPTQEIDAIEFIDLPLLITQVRQLPRGHDGPIQAKTIDGVAVTVSKFVVQITLQLIKNGILV